MPVSQNCPVCGAELPIGSPAGQCVKCLLHCGLLSTSSERGSGSTESERESDESQSTGSTEPLVIIEKPGDRIGHYKLLQQIGEGGMGVVYMAEQQAPIIRKVALKIIKLGMDTRHVVARFEAERQALALMDHPNIARVFDAGSTQSGRPYFVMELVHGVQIINYCDAAKFNISQRLQLFIQVCSAIQHAHQKGIIHRDIKPSNVLITLVGDQPVPKVIDFGIAKSTQQRLTEKTLFTHFLQFIGTPAYMSPEQASLSGEDIDTRSDIYALGVLLYELLTSKTPFGTRELMAAGYAEIGRIIRDVEPPKPSTRLGTMGGKELQSAALRRSVEPKRLGLFVRGDLDRIVMKAIEKDRSRRYGTANDFAADVLHFLHDEPVTAVPPSATYKCRKFAHRHRAVVSVSIAFFLLLAGGITVTTMLAIFARAARNKEASANERLKGQIAATESAKRSEREQRLLTEQALERMEIQKAEELLTGANASAGIAYLARVVRRNPANRVAVGRLVSSLTDRNSALPDIKGLSHSAKINSLSFSADGRLALSCSDDRMARIWDIRNASLLFEIKHEQAVTFGTFNPNGGLVLTVSSNVVQLFETQNGAPFGNPIVHESEVYSAAFSPNGESIVTAALKAQLWKTKTGQPSGAPLAEDDPTFIYAVFSPDGNFVATCNVFDEARVWNASDGSPVTRPLKHESDRSDLFGHRLKAVFDPNSQYLLTAGTGRSAILWEIAKGKPYFEPLLHKKIVNDAQFSPDGSVIATVSSDKTMRLWDAHSGRSILEPFSHDAEVSACQFTDDGQKILTTSYDQSISIWDASGLRFLDPIKPSTLTSRSPWFGLGNSGVVPARISADGLRVLMMTSETEARIWDVRKSKALPTILPDERSVRSIEISLDGNQLLTTSPLKGTMRSWDLTAGKSVAEIFQLSGQIYSAKFSPDARQIVTTSRDYTACVWDAKSGHLLCGPLRHDGIVFEAESSPDGQRLVSTSSNDARLWDLARNPPEFITLPKPRAMTIFAHFSPDGRRILTSDANGFIQIIDGFSGKPTTKPLKLGELISTAFFSPDSQRFVTACADGKARIWSSENGTPLARPMSHLAGLSSARFSPTGDRIVTASADGTARIWRADTGYPITEPLRHAGGVAWADFSPDGLAVLTASLDSTVRVWDALTGQPLTEPIQHEDSVTFACFSPNGQRIFTLSGQQARIFEYIPRQKGQTPGWLPELAEALAGQRLNDNILESVPPSNLEKFKTTSAGPATNGYNSWAQWLLADRGERPGSPYSTSGVKEYVAHLIEDDEIGHLRTAVRLSPTNALAVARLARHILTDGESSPRARIEAQGLIRFSKRLDPKEPEVFWAEAISLENANQKKEALNAMETADKLGLSHPDFYLLQGIYLEQFDQPDRALLSYGKASKDTVGTERTRVDALLKRSNLLKKLGRFTEAQSDLDAYLTAKGIPLRALDARASLIDLSACYNMPISRRGILASLNLGAQTLSGVEFDVRAFVKTKPQVSEVTSKVEQRPTIEVNRRCRRLHFLHAADNGPFKPDGTEVGQYIVRYEDNTSERISLVLGRDLKLFWESPSAENKELIVAWVGEKDPNSNRGRRARLFRTTWENPKQTVSVKTVEIVATKTPIELLLAAITVE